MEESHAADLSEPNCMPYITTKDPDVTTAMNAMPYATYTNQ